jgi:hypothetical protein
LFVCLFVSLSSVIVKSVPLENHMCPIGNDLQNKTINLRHQVGHHLCEGSIASKVISAYFILYQIGHRCGRHNSDA